MQIQTGTILPAAAVLLACALHAEAGPIAAGPTPAGTAVTGARSVQVPGTSTVLYLWDEGAAPHYAVSRDGGATLEGRTRETDYTLEVRYAAFDPLVAVPGVPEELRARAESSLHVVQFFTVSLDELRARVEALGGEIVRFLPNHGHIVRMSGETAARVEALPYVRWVGPFHPAYKLSPDVLSSLVVGAPATPHHYSIEVFKRGEAEQDRVAGLIERLGGSVMNMNPRGFRMTVTMTPSQLMEVVKRDEVHFIERWGPGGSDMDIIREIGGANFLESALGLTGEGVRGEVFDTGVDVDHPEWAGRAPLIHSSGVTDSRHGTGIFGICFAEGVNAQARGLLPGSDGGIFYTYNESSSFGGNMSRHQIAEELVDPNGPYRAVFQTASVGNPRGTLYTAISAEMDDVIFTTDLLHLQSQGDGGGGSRPEAWAKNNLSAGGIRHHDTLTRNDDLAAQTSTGPAEDGRVKPTLTLFNDSIFTTDEGASYSEFGGSSGATAEVAGYAGLVHQMWHEGVWVGHGGGASVFDSRPSSTTVRALMINSAHRYDWTPGASPGTPDGISRFFQGWGTPDVKKALERAERTFVQDAVEPIRPLQTHAVDFDVAAGEDELLVTMVYMDPMGTTSATQHRINDLSLRVTSPSGTVYWGNAGLVDSNISTPGGSSDTISVEENVFLPSPEPGRWLIEVIADEIVQDAALQTPEIDADYSLVASGGEAVLGVAIRPGAPFPALVPPGEPAELTVIIDPRSSAVVPGSEMLHYRLESGAFTSVMLTPLGGELYSGTIPAAECGQTPEFYFSAEDAAGGTVTLPRDGPGAPLRYDIGELAATNELAAGFEGGLPAGWTASGLWNVTDQCAPAPPCEGSQFAYFGLTSSCNYSTGARAVGELTAPMIAMPVPHKAGSLTLSYCYNYERESNANFDVATVTINGEIVHEPQPTNEWVAVEVDLTAYAGQSVQLRFEFDSIDGTSNEFRGFQVDDVKVVSVSLECEDCYADCTGEGVLDIFDFICFQDAFVAMDPYADCTGNSVFDIFDFICFQDAFVVGCP